MKPIIPALLLLALLLTGCGSKETLPPTTTEATDITEPAPTQPAGLYDPDSLWEAQTAGGVKVFPLELKNVRDIQCLQNSILVFSGGENDTSITQLSGDVLYPENSVTINAFLYAGDLQFHENGFSFFHPTERRTIILSSSLQEIRSIPAPDGLTGTPMLSRDQSTLYYCTPGSIRALDLDSGISRLLKEHSGQEMTVVGLHLGDFLLKIQLEDQQGLWRSLYISTSDGQTLWEDSGELQLHSFGSRYFATRYEGSIPMHLFGVPGETATELLPLHPEASCFYLPGNNAIVTTAYTGEAQVLEYYDLSSGQRTAILSFPTDHYIHSITECPDGRVGFLRYEESYGCDVLYTWDPIMTLTGDTAVYTAAHATAENPDFAGLEECSAYARSLSEKHGVEILIYKDAVAVEATDYDLIPEHNVSVIRRELELLDKHLSLYPAGFLSILSDHFDGIRICIVKSLEGSAEYGSLDTAAGVQFFHGCTAYIALAAHMDTEYALYHEMCHLIDSVVLTESNAYDRWDTLNPKDFAYDNSYITNANRDGSAYLKSGTQSFIDTYSMSYPKEDRARIMEYAMTEGNEICFESKAMQKKLLTLCQGIRDAFGLKKSPETFLWEQYLTASLAYTE